MSRHNKPETKLDIMGRLALSPEKNPGLFNESKQHSKYFKKPPSYDSAGDNIELLAMQCEREHQTMVHCQKILLADGQNNQKLNAKRIEEAYKLNLSLREGLENVNSFLKDCDDKRLVSLKKITKEKQTHNELKAYIRNIRNGIKELTIFRDTIKKTVQAMEPYEKVMNEVITKSTFYTSVKDCTERVDALMLVQTEIYKMKEAKLDQIEERRKQMSKMVNEASMTVLAYLTELTRLERDFDRAKSECLNWEKTLASLKNTIANANKLHERIFDGVHVIYHDLCRRRGLPTVVKTFEQEMDFLKEEIEIFKMVAEECNRTKK